MGIVVANLFIPQLNELALAGYLWMYIGMALNANVSSQLPIPMPVLQCADGSQTSDRKVEMAD